MQICDSNKRFKKVIEKRDSKKEFKNKRLKKVIEKGDSIKWLKKVMENSE